MRGPPDVCSDPELFGTVLMKCAALITAGGLGKRMASHAPKQYLELNGRPVLAWTIAAFETHPLIERIVVTVPPGDEEFCLEKVVRPFGFEKVKEIIAGGDDRQASVRHGLENLAGTEFVAVHDGVRPLVSSDTITRSIEAAEVHGAAVACVPVRETVKKQIGPYLQTVSRSDLLFARTPQTFRTQLIIDAHRRALQDRFVGTDDAVLVERLGWRVVPVEDSDTNIKITTPADLIVAGILLKKERE
ncbi:MAG TPA: 2-C-methyl-D-erythritol 4-phosphate cytidylyltransferase [Desulfomonilaceae bacterium]|nr:2-C-methyl-D-erythritol 4-phosphate cytidylyltransferase [Desulfomonilaceae bacterium]